MKNSDKTDLRLIVEALDNIRVLLGDATTTNDWELQEIIDSLYRRVEAKEALPNDDSTPRAGGTDAK